MKTETKTENLRIKQKKRKYPT